MPVFCNGDEVVVTGEVTSELLKTVARLGSIKGRTIKLDISAIPYIASSGIATVAAFATQIKELGGQIKVKIHPKVEKIFKITEIDKILSVEVA